jgi:hypothetical protein
MPWFGYAGEQGRCRAGEERCGRFDRDHLQVADRKQQTMLKYFVENSGRQFSEWKLKNN